MGGSAIVETAILTSFTTRIIRTKMILSDLHSFQSNCYISDTDELCSNVTNSFVSIHQEINLSRYVSENVIQNIGTDSGCHILERKFTFFTCTLKSNHKLASNLIVSCQENSKSSKNRLLQQSRECGQLQKICSGSNMFIIYYTLLR